MLRRLIFLLLMAGLLHAGCGYLDQGESAGYPAEELLGQELINDYLAGNVGISGYGGDVFCAYDLLSSVADADGTVFIWALCQEFYLDQGSLTVGSGISLSVAVQTQEKDDQIEIVGHLIPRDGNYYGVDIQDIFPRSTWSLIMPEDLDDIELYNSRANELSEATWTKAREYYDSISP